MNVSTVHPLPIQSIETRQRNVVKKSGRDWSLCLLKLLDPEPEAIRMLLWRRLRTVQQLESHHDRRLVSDRWGTECSVADYLLCDVATKDCDWHWGCALQVQSDPCNRQQLEHLSNNFQIRSLISATEDIINVAGVYEGCMLVGIGWWSEVFACS